MLLNLVYSNPYQRSGLVLDSSTIRRILTNSLMKMASPDDCGARSGASWCDERQHGT